MNIILTVSEVEALQKLVEITELKVQKAELELQLYKMSQKVHVGDDISSDPGYVADLEALKKDLEYYKLLLVNSIIAEPKDDKIGIGSLVSVVNDDTKKEITFLLVQKYRIPKTYKTDVKMVSEEAPIAEAIKGKGALQTYRFKNGEGKEVNGVITSVNNQYGAIKQGNVKTL